MLRDRVVGDSKEFARSIEKEVEFYELSIPDACFMGGNISFPKEFTKGFVVIETIPATAFLDVVAVYTYKNIEPRPR